MAFRAIRRSFLSLLLVATLWSLPVISSLALAESEVRLDDDVKRALAALPVIEGPALSEEAFQGKVVAVTFFASWCPPCTAEFRHFKELKSHYGDALSVIAVNIYEDFGGRKDPQRMAAFLERTAPNFHLLGEGEKVREAFGDVRRIPTAFVFDARGEAVFQFIHEKDAEKMFANYDELSGAVEVALTSPH